MINPGMLPPQGGDGGPPQGGGPPVTMYTQAAIQALHDAIANEPDAEDKQALSQALQIVLKIQAKNMREGQGGQGAGPGQALAGMLGGGGSPVPTRSA
jgi:hypothetical protein